MIVRFPCGLKSDEVAHVSNTLQNLATWPIAVSALDPLRK